MKMKSSKQFRILSALLSCLMLLNMMAITSMAEDAAITTSITSHKDGDVIEGGNVVILTAECNDATLSRIDFYANGNKLPGYAANGEGLVWQTPAAGKYTLKAVGINSTNGETPSEEITVYVKPEDVGLSFYSTADLTGLKNNNTQFGDNTLTADHAAIGKYSAMITKPAEYIKYEGAAITCAPKTYFNMLFYAEGLSDAKNGVAPYTLQVKGSSTKSASGVLKNGWNVCSVNVSAIQESDITGVYLFTPASTRSGYENTGLTADERVALTIYINGFYFSDDNTVTASPVIPDGQANVCNGLTTYRINFNKPLAFDLTSDELAESVSITYGTDGTISGLTVEPGVDYIDVLIPESSLDTDGTTYTVTVAANKVRDCYGAYYAGGSFTFSTIGSGCTTAAPIPMVTYPKADSVIGTDAALAASVIFSGNVSKVEFVEVNADESETILGEAAKATGEWTLSSATGWSAGSHTVKAKVTTTAESDNVFYSDAVTFTVAVTDYRLVGMENGDVVVLGETLGRTLSVIDDNTDTHKVTLGKSTHNGTEAATTVTLNAPTATATNISKVVYSVEGVKCGEVTSAPYTFEITTSKLGTNTLTVDIHDVLGKVTTITRTFNAVYGYDAQSWSEGFEGETPAFAYTSLDAYPDAAPTSGTDVRAKSFETFTGTDSNSLYLYSGAKYDSNAPFIIGLMPEGLNLTNSVNKVFVEFDYNRSGYGGWNLQRMKIGEGFDKSTGKEGAYATLLLPQACVGATNNKTYSNKIGLAISWDNTAGTITIVFYIDGVECFRQSGPLNYRTAVDPTKLYAQFWGTPTGGKYWLDNLRVNAYSVPDDVTVFANANQEREYSAAGNAEITVANISATDAAALTNFVAVYDSSDRLVNVMPYAVPLAANTLSDTTYPVSLAAGQYAKIFTLFDGTLKPITLK